MGNCSGKVRKVDVLDIPDLGGDVKGSEFTPSPTGSKIAPLREELKEELKEEWPLREPVSRSGTDSQPTRSQSSIRSQSSWRLLGIPDAPRGVPIAVPRRSRELPGLQDVSPTTLLRVQFPSGFSERSIGSHSTASRRQLGSSSKLTLPTPDGALSSGEVFRPSPMDLLPQQEHPDGENSTADESPRGRRLRPSDQKEQEGDSSASDGKGFSNDSLLSSMGSKDDGYFPPTEKRIRERAIQPSESSRQTRKLRYKKGELLGKGAVGTVYLALDMDTGKLIAVKEIQIVHSGNDGVEKQLAKLEREIEMMRGLRHSHVVKYKGVRKHDRVLAIFMEYVPGGSLASLAREFGGFTEKVLVKYAKQVLEGLHYLHCHRIVHCDVKGGNILVTRDGVCKLTDFGASREVAELAKSSKGGIYRLAGTPFWMAPEVIRQAPYGRKADIWSFGCTMVEMATGSHPWPQFDDPMVAIYHISSNEVQPYIPDHLSPVAQDFISKCLAHDPTERPTAHELLSHPFLAEDRAVPRTLSSRSNRIGHRKYSNGTARSDSRESIRSRKRENSAPEGHVTAVSLTMSIDGNEDFVPELWRNGPKRKVIQNVIKPRAERASSPDAES